MQCLIAGKKPTIKSFFQQVTQDSSAENQVIAHMKATYHFEQASNTKGAGLIAALLQTPEYLNSTREWYRERIAKLDISTEVGRRARLVFFATEGLLFYVLLDS